MLVHNNCFCCLAYKGKLPTIFTKYFSKQDQKRKDETKLSDTKNYFRL